MLKFFEYNPFLNEPDAGVEMQLKSVLSEFRNLMRQNQVLKSKSVMSFTNRNNSLLTQQSALSYSQPPEPRMTEDQRNVSQILPDQRESHSASFISIHQEQDPKQSEAPVSEEVDHYSVYEKRRTTLKKESDIVEFEEQLRNSTQGGSQFKRKSGPQEAVISPKPSNPNQEFSVKDIGSYSESNKFSINQGQSESRLTQPDRNTNVSNHSKVQSTTQTPKPSNPNVFDPYENSSLSVKNEAIQSRVSEANYVSDGTPKFSKDNIDADGSIRNSELNAQSKISQTQKLSSTTSRHQTNQSIHDNPEANPTTVDDRGTNLTQQSRSNVHSNLEGLDENVEKSSTLQKESLANIDRSQISTHNPSNLQQPRTVQGRSMEYSMSAKESDLGESDHNQISHHQTLNDQNQERFTGISQGPTQTNLTRVTNQDEAEAQRITQQTQNKLSNLSNNEKGNTLLSREHPSNISEVNRVSGIDNEQKLSQLSNAKQSNLSNVNRGTNVGGTEINQSEIRNSDLNEENKVSKITLEADENVRISNNEGIPMNQYSISKENELRQTNASHQGTLRQTNVSNQGIVRQTDANNQSQVRQSNLNEGDEEPQTDQSFNYHEAVNQLQGKPSQLSADRENTQSIRESEQLPNLPSTYSKGIQMTNLNENQINPGYGIETKNASVNAPGSDLWKNDKNVSLNNTNMSSGKDSSIFKPTAQNQNIGSMKVFDVPDSFSLISQVLAMGERQPRDTAEIRFFRPSDATPSQKNVLRVAFQNVPESYRKIDSSGRNTDHSFDKNNFDSFKNKNSTQQDGIEIIPEEERRGSRTMSQAENNLYDYIERRISTLAANSKIEVHHVSNAESTRKKSKSIFQNLPNLSDLGIDGSSSINLNFGDKDSTKRAEYIKMFKPTKNLTLPQLKDFAEEFYEAKRGYDIRCDKMETPRVTAEEFLCIYLKQKYGLNELVQEWAFTIVASMKKYADKDVDISVFFHVS